MNSRTVLRAAQDTPGPQAVTADGERIAMAILFVIFGIFAATAIRAGRKIKFSHPLPKGYIIRLQPNRLQG